MKKNIKKSILLLTILFCSYINLFAEKAQKNIQRIAIYNFKVIKNHEPKENEAATIEKNYNYYSFIIPQTIFKTMSKNYGYEIIRKLDTIKMNGSDNKKLAELGKKNLVDYLVSGTCIINKDNLEMKVEIFDTRGNETRIVNDTTDETGVILKNITQRISEQLNTHIAEIEKINALRFRPSEILPLFGPLSNISVGMDFGYIKILGNFSDFYNDRYFVSPYFNYKINKYLSIQLKYDYLETNSQDKETVNNLELSYQAGTIGAEITLLPMTNELSLTMALTGGIAHSKILLDSSEPFSEPLDETNSWDPYFSSTMDIKYEPGFFFINIGADYRQIFYEGKDLYMLGGHIGTGIHF